MKILPPPGPARTKQLVLLGILMIGAVYALTRVFGGATPASTPSPASNSPARPVTQSDAGKSALPEKVALDKLEPVPEEPAATRNPFRFGTKPAPPAPPPPAYVPPAYVPPAPPVPQVPTVPPIPLKFIGRVVMPDKKVLATFSDGKMNVLHGAEGQVIDGRYRVVRIGDESVVVEYVNGTGRTTLPLRGS